MLWRRWRALRVMSRHERWRVAMGCPGIGREARGRDALTPVRGEVYCRCSRCHAARGALGWAPLFPLPPAPVRPSPMIGER